MIEVVTKHSIEEILETPTDYVDSEQDIVLVKVHGKEVGNPVMIMIGTDDDLTKEKDKIVWYFLLEDNDQEFGKLVSTQQGLKDNYEAALKLAAHFAEQA